MKAKGKALGLMFPIKAVKQVYAERRDRLERGQKKGEDI